MLKIIYYVQLSPKIDSQFNSGKKGNSRRTLMCLIKIHLRNSYISSNSQTFTLNMQSGRSCKVIACFVLISRGYRHLTKWTES